MVRNRGKFRLRSVRSRTDSTTSAAPLRRSGAHKRRRNMNRETRESHDDKTHDDKQTYEVSVFAPRDPSDRRQFIWSKHLTVGEAAAQAAQVFGIQGGQPTLAKDSKALNRS